MPAPGPDAKTYTLEELAVRGREDVQRIEQERVRNRNRALRDMLGHAGIPPRFVDRGFSNYQADTSKQQQALRVAREYAEQFEVQRRGGLGLIFTGSTGTGKSHLACAIGKHVMRSGHSAVFVSTLELLQIAKESYRPGSDASERQVIRRFVEPDLLMLDEVGVQHRTAGELTVLTELVNQRYANLRPMILITNLAMPQLSELLGQRITSRLREVCDVVVCDWEDYRARA